jgi:hypothetical protein
MVVKTVMMEMSLINKKTTHVDIVSAIIAKCQSVFIADMAIVDKLFKNCLNPLGDWFVSTLFVENFGNSLAGEDKHSTNRTLVEKYSTSYQQSGWTNSTLFSGILCTKSNGIRSFQQFEHLYYDDYVIDLELIKNMLITRGPVVETLRRA